MATEDKNTKNTRPRESPATEVNVAGGEEKAPDSGGADSPAESGAARLLMCRS